MQHLRPGHDPAAGLGLAAPLIRTLILAIEMVPTAVSAEALALAQRVKDVRFRNSRRNAYDMRDVDAFLMTLERALRRGDRLDASQVRAHQFQVTGRYQYGYAQKAVQDFMNEIARHAEGA